MNIPLIKQLNFIGVQITYLLKPPKLNQSNGHKGTKARDQGKKMAPQGHIKQDKNQLELPTNLNNFYQQLTLNNNIPNYLMTFRDRRGQLYIYDEGNICKDKLIYFEGTNLLGRNPIKTSLTIKDRSISQIHCKIICKNNVIKIVDLNSKNGVYINNLENPIDPNVEVEINSQDDVVYFAQIRCRFVSDPLKRDNQEETKQISFRVQAPEKNNNVSVEKKNNVGGKEINEDFSKKQVTTKEKNEQNPTSKDNKKTKKQEIDQKQKDKQKQQLLKDIFAEEEQIKKEKSRQKANKEKQKRQKEKQIEKEKEKEKEREREREQETKQKKQGKKKTKKQSKQKSQDKINKQEDKNSKKPNSKEKIKVGNQKQTIINDNKKTGEKNDPIKQKQPNKGIRNQTVQPIIDRKQNNTNAEIKNQLKPKRGESGQTKVKGGKSKKSKSEGKPVQKGGVKSKPPLCRKKLPEPLSDSFSDHPRRSIIQKTALLSGFTLTFKPSTKITITENWREKFDVLVMEKYARTFKLLYALCLGIPLVTINWILESEYRRGIVPFERFFLQAPEKDMLYRSVCKAKDGYKVFKDLEFYLVETEQNFHLPIEQVQALIQAGGGIIKKQLNKKNKQVIFLVKLNPNAEDMKILRKIQGCEKIYTIQLILDSCLHQEINWQQNKVTKN